jgi:hypothetical protein
MRGFAATCALLLLITAHGHAAATEERALILPHPLRAGEMAWLEVQVGPIGRGQEIEVTTAGGQELGTISPYGGRYGQPAGTFTLPVPADALRDGRVSVRLTVSGGGGPPHAATAQEVPGVRLMVGGGAG